MCGGGGGRENGKGNGKRRKKGRNIEKDKDTENMYGCIDEEAKQIKRMRPHQQTETIKSHNSFIQRAKSNQRTQGHDTSGIPRAHLWVIYNRCEGKVAGVEYELRVVLEVTSGWAAGALCPSSSQYILHIGGRLGQQLLRGNVLVRLRGGGSCIRSRTR